MSVVVIGVSHRSCPLDLLERMTVPDDRVTKALADVISRPHIGEAVLLSTCNRTEMYILAERFHGAYEDVRNAFCAQSHLPPEAFAENLFTHYDADAAEHLFSVTSGLDSAVLGETEIQGQVKRAWELAKVERAAGPVLNALFQQAVKVGKRARRETGISANVTSVSRAAVAMASEHLGGLAGRRILVLGAGEMGQGMIGALGATGAAEIVIANRTWDRAVELADQVGGRPVRLIELARELAGIDLLLTSTGASSLMLEHGELEQVMATREQRELLVVDIAVPRDVDPAAAEIEGVTLLDMDDLRAFADAGVAERRREVERVRDIIRGELDRFAQGASHDTGPLVAAFRLRAEEIRRREIDRYAAQLADVDVETRESIEAMTRQMLAKLLHEPTVRLHRASGTARGDRLADTLRDLFDL